MRIDPGTVVRLAYELRDADGEALEEDGAEMEYLHGGYGGIFPKVEAALAGKEPGDEMSITLEPDDAFGEYDAELLRVEPRERFPEEVEVGMRFEGVPGDREEEALIYTVTEITPEGVVVDGNHPLAGERLWFKCAVKEVRPATPDELSHGHPHGGLGVHTH
ncbi:MAG TPA: peptidylprolyl isomerase [Usitatibacter sp.]|jgi:FKBP-type peptidyl-prolyl cis-trans isomerase SlyD